MYLTKPRRKSLRRRAPRIRRALQCTTRIRASIFNLRKQVRVALGGKFSSRDSRVEEGIHVTALTWVFLSPGRIWFGRGKVRHSKRRVSRFYLVYVGAAANRVLENLKVGSACLAATRIHQSIEVKLKYRGLPRAPNSEKSFNRS